MEFFNFLTICSKFKVSNAYYVVKNKLKELFLGLISKEVSSSSKCFIKQISKNFIYKLIKNWGRRGLPLSKKSVTYYLQLFHCNKEFTLLQGSLKSGMENAFINGIWQHGYKKMLCNWLSTFVHEISKAWKLFRISEA